MSLQLAAQHLSSKGRGNDSRLIHISPKELQGLQALAKAKGGSLTINPETGLPEAGFLEDVLPIAATAALMFIPGGPALAGAVGGGITGGLATGALATGIGTGLLAGGASILGQALGGGKVDMGKAATTGLLSGVAGGMFAPGTPTADVSTSVKALEAAQSVPAGAGSGVDKAFAFNSAGEMVPSNYAADITGATNLPPSSPAASKSFFGSLSPKEKLGYGLAGTAALSLLGGQQKTGTQAPSSPSYIRPYNYSQSRNPNFGQPGEAYYNQSYAALPPYRAAAGGIMGGASYPQSGIDSTQYAVPSQMPTSAEVVAGDYDMATNPYTGMPSRMAEGGNTNEAVKQYNEQLAKQAAEEYVNAPVLAAFKSAPPPVAKKEEQAPSIGEGVKGLYQYYLGRQPSAEEIPQWSDKIQSTGMVTPEEAAYFRQFIGGEQAARKFTPTGPDPFGQMANNQGMIAQLGGQMPTAVEMNPYQYVAGKGYIPNPNYRPATIMPVGQPIIADTGGGAGGGLMPYNLGGYSDGGRLLKGPGDGVSDNIPATIGSKQPARLADGEFVIPARIVSEIGNGSTDAGARRLYAMMDRVQDKRKKSSKKGKFAIDSKAEKVLPA
jgi:hypothetical protein